MSKRLLLAASLLALGLAAGCGDACLSLANQICSCQPDQTSVDGCNQRAQESAGIFPVTKANDAYCQKQLDTHACDCTKLDTAEGRVNCGIAYTWSAPGRAR